MKKRGRVFIVAGLLLIVGALFLVVYNINAQKQAAQSAASVADKLEKLIPETVSGTQPQEELGIPDYILNPEMEMPVQSIDGEEYIGILKIAELEIELPITKDWSYSSLKTSPGRYCGSAYSGSLIIAGHNYASHFGRLKTLHDGSAITFTDMDGNVFNYKVAELEILKSDAIEEMKGGNWDLTLFTCTVGGQSRVTVRCEAVS